jgi:hypothetical protein
MISLSWGPKLEHDNGVATNHSGPTFIADAAIPPAF